MDTAVILPPDYRPSPDEEYMNEYQVEYFRQKLLSWKKSLLEQSKDTHHPHEHNKHKGF